MTEEERFFSRQLYRMKIKDSEGNAFEKLFTETMCLANPNFMQVKPQGSLGDKKNDGFDPTQGIYYQVYAPENIKEAGETAVKKLKEDFQGLLNYWPQHKMMVKAFRYVINDKFKSVGPLIISEINAMDLANPGIDVKLFLAKDLERVFMNLSDDDKISLTGPVPCVDQEYSSDIVMRDVVDYIMNKPSNVVQLQIPQNPSFLKKIKFNKLSDSLAMQLQCMLTRIGDVDSYFSVAESFQKESLKNRFTSLYLKACRDVENSEDNPDDVFMYMFKKLCPPNLNSASATVVMILMTYYFETCDIFKVPID